MATICFAVGTAISAGLKMRVIELRNFVAMLDEMSVLIRFRAIRTRELIEEISSRDSFGGFIFLNMLSDFLECDDDINKSWKNAASKTFFLSDSDRNILLNVGEQIGSTDIDGQLSMLALNKSLAERNLYDAENEYRIKGKMIRTVWSLCGLAAGIMII